MRRYLGFGRLILSDSDVNSGKTSGTLSRVTERILCLSKHFSYGHGGTPEALLLMARALRAWDVACDVRCQSGFFEDVGKYEDLPRAGTKGSQHISHRIADYTALLVVGAWNPIALPLAIAARSVGVIVLYAPKGQLCRFEFRLMRDVRKVAYLALIEIWIALLAKKILFTSVIERESTLLPLSVLKKRACVLPEPLDGDRLGTTDRTIRKPGAQLHFGFVGQISARKGVMELVDGFLLAMQTRPDNPAVLSIAGTSVPSFEETFESIKRRSQTHPQGWRVRFLGQVSGEGRSALYNDIDIMIVPSHFESYGLVVLEALWCGCAVIAGPALGVLEYLLQREEILVLSEISPTAISRAIGFALDDPDVLLGSAIARRQMIPQGLQSKEVAGRLLQLLRPNKRT